jgi:hypothetical protein
MSGEENAYSVILFHTNSAALRAEKFLLREGLIIKLIPGPRQLSSDCGIALRFDRNQETSVREILETASVPIDSIHFME